MTIYFQYTLVDYYNDNLFFAYVLMDSYYDNLFSVHISRLLLNTEKTNIYLYEHQIQHRDMSPLKTAENKWGQILEDRTLKWK